MRLAHAGPPSANKSTSTRNATPHAPRTAPASPHPHHPQPKSASLPDRLPGGPASKSHRRQGTAYLRLAATGCHVAHLNRHPRSRPDSAMMALATVRPHSDMSLGRTNRQPRHTHTQEPDVERCTGNASQKPLAKWHGWSAHTSTHTIHSRSTTLTDTCIHTVTQPPSIHTSVCHLEPPSTLHALLRV